MDSCSGSAVVIKFLARELPLEQHLCALWKDEVVKEAGGGGRQVESEFLQRGKPNAFAGRSGGWSGQVYEANLDEFEQRTSFQERCQVQDGSPCCCQETEPRERGEVEAVKIRAKVV